MPKKPKAVPDDCMPKCGTCAFIEREPGAEAGYCRRYPPQVVATEDGEWSAYPVVDLVDWCGEYVRRTN